MINCNNKFWLENISNLLCKFQIIPTKNMNIETKMNSITRLVIIIYILLILFSHNKYNALYFLLISLIFIIILYYIQKKDMENFKENYEQPNKSIKFVVKPPRKNNEPINTSNLYLDDSTKCTFCNPTQKVSSVNPDEWNTLFVDNLNRSAGPPNPKTLIPPVVAAPIADLDFWKTNNLIVHSAINDQVQFDAYQSGYQVSTCCGNLKNKVLTPQNNKNNIEKFQRCLPKIQQTLDCSPVYNKNVQENFTFPYQIQNNDNLGQVDTSCGYNPQQLNVNLPSNYSTGLCQQQPQYSNYNKNLFTQTIQPGIYSRNEIIEPINSNIGISFNQQFEPLTCKSNDNEIIYTENDPNVMEPTIFEPNYKLINSVDNANVYDPRYSGYGTSYRSYTDENLGQTKFYYDDINSIRMPNYITRNNIDFAPFADSYGSLSENNINGNEYHSSIKALANDAFTRSTIQQRTELQERLTRKQRANAWQQRVAPINKGNQRMLGGLSRR